MKHILGGATLAVLMALSLPTLAQSSDDADQKAQSVTSGPRAERHHARATGHEVQANDSMADELNRQELQRLQANGVGAPTAGRTAPSDTMRQTGSTTER